MFRRQRKTWSFHIVVLQRMAKKCTKIYNARAQLLFCELNLLFGALHVPVIVMVCLGSLLLFLCILTAHKNSNTSCIKHTLSKVQANGHLHVIANGFAWIL